MANSIGQLVIITKETSKMMKDTVMEKCSGLVEVSMKETGNEEYSMGWEKCSFLMET